MPGEFFILHLTHFCMQIEAANLLRVSCGRLQQLLQELVDCKPNAVMRAKLAQMQAELAELGKLAGEEDEDEEEEEEEEEDFEPAQLWGSKQQASSRRQQQQQQQQGRR